MKELRRKNSPPKLGGVAPRSASPTGRSLKKGAGMVLKAGITVVEPPRLASLDTPPNLGGEPNEEFRELYDFAPIAFVTIDRRGVIRTLNRRAANLLAFPIEWLRARPFLVFVAPRDAGRFVEMLIRLLRMP